MMRRTSFAIGAAVALLAVQAVADPYIDTTDATLTAGVAPTAGHVVVYGAAAAAKAPAVPRIEPVGTIGGFSSAMPGALRPFSGGTAFVASGTATIPGGVYEYASYSVPEGTVVTYDGAATIRVAGDVAIFGRVSTSTPSFDALTFEAGGGVAFGPSASVDTAVFQDVVFDSVGTITASAGAAFSSESGTVTMRARGTPTAASNIRLDGVRFDSDGVVLQASGGVSMSGGSTVEFVAGDVTLQAFGGDVTMSGGSFIHATGSVTAWRFEASDSIRVEGQGAGFQVTGANVRMRAFGGGLSIADGASLRMTGGAIDLGALGTVALEAGTSTGMTAGAVRLKSFGSDVALHTSALTGTVLNVDIAAARDVVVDGAGYLGTGSVRVAAGRDVVQLDRARWKSGVPLVVLAGRSIVAPHRMEVDAPSAVFAAETGEISVGALDCHGGYGDGAFRAVAFGAVTVGGSISVWGPVELASRTAGVDVSGCSIETLPPVDASVSSPVTIESFAGAVGRIAAVGATIATGSATETSGDIRLLVHAGEIVEPVEGFLVPTRVAVRRLRTGETVLAASGFLDTGSASLAVGDDATLTIGDVALPASLTDVGRGRLRATGDGFELDLVPDPAGSSRVAFRLRSTGDVSGFLAADLSGELKLGIASVGVTVSGAVTLTKGAYPSGRFARAARSSDVYVSRLAGRLPGALDATFGLGVSAESVSASSTVRVAVGDRFSVVVPTWMFEERPKGVFRAVRPEPGVRLVVIDARAGTIRIVAPYADLRTSDGHVPKQLVAGVSIDKFERRVLVRVRHSGTRVSY